MGHPGNEDGKLAIDISKDAARWFELRDSFCDTPAARTAHRNWRETGSDLGKVVAKASVRKTSAIDHLVKRKGYSGEAARQQKRDPDSHLQNCLSGRLEFRPFAVSGLFPPGQLRLSSISPFSRPAPPDTRLGGFGYSRGSPFDKAPWTGTPDSRPRPG